MLGSLVSKKSIFFLIMKVDIDVVATKYPFCMFNESESYGKILLVYNVKLFVTEASKMDDQQF